MDGMCWTPPPISLQYLPLCPTISYGYFQQSLFPFWKYQFLNSSIIMCAHTYSTHAFHNIHFTVLPIILFLYCRLVRMLVTYVLFKDTVDWMKRLLIICILVYKYHIFLYCKLVRVQVIEIMFKDTVDWTKRLVIIYWYTTVLSIINHNNGSAREQLKSCETKKVF